ncbi:hypothetical protein DSM25558_5482 [Agrobacterium sp. DSM 25558]|nr:hypothetical protein DSM25558_5482 [Agrobacterium sp. DSM 25558]
MQENLILGIYELLGFPVNAPAQSRRLVSYLQQDKTLGEEPTTRHSTQ